MSSLHYSTKNAGRKNWVVFWIESSAAILTSLERLHAETLSAAQQCSSDTSDYREVNRWQLGPGSLSIWPCIDFMLLTHIEQACSEEHIPARLHHVLLIFIAHTCQQPFLKRNRMLALSLAGCAA